MNNYEMGYWSSIKVAGLNLDELGMAVRAKALQKRMATTRQPPIGMNSGLADHIQKSLSDATRAGDKEEIAAIMHSINQHDPLLFKMDATNARDQAAWNFRDVHGGRGIDPNMASFSNLYERSKRTTGVPEDMMRGPKPATAGQDIDYDDIESLGVPMPPIHAVSDRLPDGTKPPMYGERSAPYVAQRPEKWTKDDHGPEGYIVMNDGPNRGQKTTPRPGTTSEDVLQAPGPQSNSSPLGVDTEEYMDALRARLRSNTREHMDRGLEELRRNAPAPDSDVEHMLIPAVLGTAGLIGGQYAMSDADTIPNKMKNLANNTLGTDFETESRFQHAKRKYLG